MRMRRLIRIALANCACAAGMHHAFRRRNARRLLILGYHGVTRGPLPPDVPEWHMVDADDFRRQMLYIRKHYHVLPVDVALERLQSGEIHRPTACLTFDDGYRNNLTVALPILRELNLPFTIYVSTGLIGTARTVWTVELDMILRTAALRPASALASELPPGGFRREWIERTIAALKSLPRSERLRRMERLAAQLKPTPEPDPGPFRIIDHSDIRALNAEPLVRLGAHTVNHEIVSRLDDAELRDEIRQSVIAIRRVAARPTATFAYPNGGPGDFDGRAREELASLGIGAALTTIPGLNEPGTNQWELRRVLVGRMMTLSEFRLAAAGLVL